MMETLYQLIYVLALSLGCYLIGHTLGKFAYVIFIKPKW